jgi:BirA family transcriptional regulator, biotin operon repressor / biotin---[acetyl-CoA-carboxylase] ligase
LRPPIHTLFIGKTHHHLARVESTNAYLRRFIAESDTLVPEGAVITATEQFGGRGQAGKPWLTESGKNIIMSVLLKPVFLEPRQVFYLNKAIALAVHDALATEIHGVKIKWPNDMVHQNKKIAGILIENVLGAHRIQQTIIGIGINVNQTEFDSSLPNPTSIINITGRETDLSELFDKICAQLEKYYLQLRTGQFTTIDALYHHHLLNHQSEQTFLYQNQKITATISGVSAGGKLILHTPTEKLELDLGEVEWVW